MAKKKNRKKRKCNKCLNGKYPCLYCGEYPGLRGCGKTTVCGEVNLARGLSLWSLSEFDSIILGRMGPAGPWGIINRSMGGRFENQSEPMPMLRRRLTFRVVTSDWDEVSERSPWLDPSGVSPTTYGLRP